MVDEILEAFRLVPGSIAVDATLGLGGHSLKFAQAITPGGALVGMDWDASMLSIATARLAGTNDVRIELVNEDFRQLGPTLDRLGLRATGILMDLGLNSAQVEDPDRGFSFRGEGPLDMRMDRAHGEPASAILNRATPAQIETALKEYGDERWARAIAKRIVERRKVNPLKTTTDLVDCVLAAIPVGAREKRIHPATRTFQAVRLMVTGELVGLGEAIVAASARLAPNGAIAVLSYHSGEDRIVKQTFRELDGEGFEVETRKPLTPTQGEIARNPRSRSAKLRTLRRTNAA